jgi:hypothetical protein
VNEAISVEVRYNSDGAITPLNFLWRGRSFEIASLGRRWERAGAQHFLVMDQSGEVYEIAFHPDKQRWTLCKAPRLFGQGSLV